MTRNEIYRRLAKLPEKGWHAKITRRGIRLRPPNGKYYCYCPITAVDRDNGGRPTRSGNVDSSIVRLEIGSETIASDLIQAADFDLIEIRSTPAESLRNLAYWEQLYMKKAKASFFLCLLLNIPLEKECEEVIKPKQLQEIQDEVKPFLNN